VPFGATGQKSLKAEGVRLKVKDEIASKRPFLEAGLAMTQFRHHFLLLPGDTIPIQKAESGHVPQAAALNTPPAKNVPFRKVNLSQGATFDALRAGKDGK